MSTISPEQLLGTIDAEGLPDTPKDAPRPLPASYRRILPGASPADTGVTDSQVKTMVRWAHQNLDLSLTWAQAVSEMRKRFITGQQRDFNIADRIINEGYKANADLRLTEDQARMVNTIILALQAPDKVGKDREQAQHWDLGIRQAIATVDVRTRKQYLALFDSVWTQGDLTVVMDRFSARFGRPQPKGGFGDVLNQEQPLSTNSDDAPPVEDKGDSLY